MTSLASKTVLVTGANRGMGRAYIGQLLNRGARRFTPPHATRGRSMTATLG